ncbi:MAG: RNA polymerase sigma factor [Candidatus Limnocylindrales bacterium]|jgi:RNA polymerase sigma-70 factor (ECF subfamily)
MTDPLRPRLSEVEVLAATTHVDEADAVTTAFELYHAELYSFLRRSTRDASAAEDLLQEAFLRLTREVDAGRTPEHLRGWLYRVASNLAISRSRRRVTAMDWLSRYGRRETEETFGSPEQDVIARERSTALDAAMATLPAETRTALLLSADGFTGEEIAAVIGRSHGATRTLLSRARVQVRLELEARGGVR